MTVFLKAKDLTQEQSLELIGNLQPKNEKNPCYLWLEAPDGWAFDKWNWKSDFKGTLPGRGPDSGQNDEDSADNENNPVNTVDWYRAGQQPEKVRAYDCLTRSTAGRLFDCAGELRWRIIPALGEACWRVVFLGSVDWVGTALDDHSDSLSALKPHNDSFFLWGQQTAQTPCEWIELRIPHRIHYPVPGNPNRVKVLVEKLCDDAGVPHFVRLCNLEAC